VQSENQVSDPDFCDSGFCLVENFDTKLNGSIHSQDDWQANQSGSLDGAVVTDTPPGGLLGKALMNSPDGIPFRGNVFKPLGSNEVQEGSLATLFFQVLAEDLLNTYTHFGLTDLATPKLNNNDGGSIAIFQDYEVQMSLVRGGVLVRNGDQTSNLTNITVESGVVYNIWMVVDNFHDTFYVYIQGGAHSTAVKGEIAGGISEFSFRNGSTQNLQTLYLINSPNFLYRS